MPSGPGMGQIAILTGRAIAWDEVLDHDHEFALDLDKLTMSSPPPLSADPDGKYPQPAPGTSGSPTKRED